MAEKYTVPNIPIETLLGYINSGEITGHLMPGIWPTGGNGVKNGIWK